MPMKHSSSEGGRPLALAIGLTLFLCLSSVGAQTFDPYSDFEAMTLSELETLQVKLTSVGVQNVLHSSVVFTSEVNSVDASVFEPFRRVDVDYSNDELAPIVSFTTTVEDLQTLIANVATLPNVVAGGVASPQLVAFTLYNDQPDVTAFDATLGVTDAADLFEQLRLALASSTAGLRALAEFACPLDLQGSMVPTDVSGDIGVALTGTRLDRATGTFVAKATITNPAATLVPPVSLVFMLPSAVRLAQDDGFTCNITPVGAQYINLDTIPGPGESTEIVLGFVNADKDVIAPSIKVFSGPGTR